MPFLQVNTVPKFKLTPRQTTLLDRDKNRDKKIDLLINGTHNPSKKIQKLQRLCVDTAMELTRQSDGGLIVIGDTRAYKTIYPNFFKNQRVNALEPGMRKVLLKLAALDGAVILDPQGNVKAYGAHVLEQTPHPGFGGRHAAAKGISKQGCLAILASRESKMVKIFKNGIALVEFNPLTKGIENHVSKIVSLVNKPEAAVVTSAAVGSSVLGIALLPGIIVFAGSYYLAKQMFRMSQGK